MEEEDLIQLYFEEGKTHYAFNLMVRKYSEQLYWPIRRILINHEDANDVLQNSFIKIWNALPKFKQDSQLYTWMYRIAMNEALGFLRKEKKHKNHDDIEFARSLSSDPYFDGDESYQAFLYAVKQLPEKQQLVFQMKYFEEKKYSEISEILGGTEGSHKASYHHAMLKIKKSLKLD